MVFENTELWKIFIEKAEKTELIDGVKKICAKGENLSKQVNRFFGTYTLHDATHLSNVCGWMYRLLGKHADSLNAGEAALLVMSAWCHDLGMVVSDEEKERLKSELGSSQWQEYFNNHFDACEEYTKNGTVSDEVLRDFVRVNHHRRIGVHIKQNDFNNLAPLLIKWEELLDLCESHGRELKTDGATDGDIVPLGEYADKTVNFCLCAVLLRLADLLDYDESRAPRCLLEYLGLDQPSTPEQERSAEEYKKNASGGFMKIDGQQIIYYMESDSLQLEKEVRSYLCYVEKELEACGKALQRYGGERWKDLPLPTKIATTIERRGYEYGSFSLTMDQDRVMELLVGQNLYKDAGVFVRELLQNSIDAVMHRRKLIREEGRRFDPPTPEYVGKIVIDTWKENGFDWFRITDDGMGMTKDIISNFFLKVGRSYYTSQDFAKDKLFSGGDYTPISRFGIGVLSCFIADPENNLLEVSTKRAPQSDNHPAIRLNVDGLHGWYDLTTDVREGSSVRPMHSPNGEEDGYRKTPGTTICVRTELRRLGGYKSFKEILDQYICYPEVKVEYRRWENGTIVEAEEYRTQQEYMDIVHGLNPDGKDAPIKEHVYPFPDELFDEIKEAFPEFDWEKRPEFVLKYYPLDWLDSSGNLNGVAVCADVRLPAHSKPIDFGGKEIQAELCYELDPTFAPDDIYSIKSVFADDEKSEIDKIKEIIEIWEEVNGKRGIGQTENTKSRFYKAYPEQKNNPEWITSATRELDLPEEKLEGEYRRISCILEKAPKLMEEYGEALKQCDYVVRKCEVDLLKYINQIDSNTNKLLSNTTDWHYSNKYPNVLIASGGIYVSYVGISIIHGILEDINSQITHFVLLFSGSYRPEFDVSRERVKSFSPESYLALCHVIDSLPNLEASVNANSSLTLLSSQQLLELLSRHPEWEQDLSLYEIVHDENGIAKKRLWSISEIDKHERTIIDYYYSHYYYSNHLFQLSLAVLKDRYAVCREFNENGLIHVSQDQDMPDKPDACFPPDLFFRPYEECGVLGYLYTNILDKDLHFYNITHPFARWLADNADTLRANRRTSWHYWQLIDNLRHAKNPSELASEINYIVGQFKRLLGDKLKGDAPVIKEIDFLTN